MAETELPKQQSDALGPPNADSGLTGNMLRREATEHQDRQDVPSPLVSAQVDRLDDLLTRGRQAIEPSQLSPTGEMKPGDEVPLAQAREATLRDHLQSQQMFTPDRNDVATRFLEATVPSTRYQGLFHSSDDVAAMKAYVTDRAPEVGAAWERAQEAFDQRADIPLPQAPSLGERIRHPLQSGREYGEQWSAYNGERHVATIREHAEFQQAYDDFVGTFLKDRSDSGE